MEAPEPIELLGPYRPLSCAHCEKDLLARKYGVFIWIYEYDSSGRQRRVMAVPTCKGECDKRISDFYESQDYYTIADNIGDLTSPLGFIRWTNTVMRDLHRGVILEPNAFDETVQCWLRAAQWVMREPTMEEWARFEDLRKI